MSEHVDDEILALQPSRPTKLMIGNSVYTGTPEAIEHARHGGYKLAGIWVNVADPDGPPRWVLEVPPGRP